MVITFTRRGRHESASSSSLRLAMLKDDPGPTSCREREREKEMGSSELRTFEAKQVFTFPHYNKTRKKEKEKIPCFVLL